MNKFKILFTDPTTKKEFTIKNEYISLKEARKAVKSIQDERQAWIHMVPINILKVYDL